MEIELEQPDGTTFGAVPWGDGRLHGYETLDGYTVVRDSHDVWRYAVERGPDGRLMPGVRRADGSPPASVAAGLRPTIDAGQRSDPLAAPVAADTVGQNVGTQPTLVLLAQFTDRPSLGTTPAHWNNAFFGTTGSVRAFYEQASYGQLDLVPATETHGTANDGVVGWLNIGYPHPDTRGSSGAANRQLTRDALIAADPFVDFSSFDTDGDGIISPDELHIVVIVAGYETSFGGADASCTPNVWGHWWMLFGAEAPVLDGVSVGAEGYTQFGEAHCVTSNPPGTMATIGIMAHEIGHDLGWPDLYDTSSETYGVGAWSIMGGGSWNRLPGQLLGSTPALPDAFSKSYQGWLTPQQVTTAETDVGIATAATTADVWQLLDNPNGVDWRFRSHSGTGEYFLVENRQLVGFDAALPGCGLLIWHIDESVTATNSANAGFPRLVNLKQADGNDDLATRASNGDAGDPYPGTSGNTLFDDTTTPSSVLYDGTPSEASVEVLSGGCGATMNVNMQVAASEQTVPGAPTGVVATAGNAEATVSWSPPASDGGSAITSYTVTASPGGQTSTVGGDLTFATVTGLINGTNYTFTAVATNAVGSGPASESSNVVVPTGADLEPVDSLDEVFTTFPPAGWEQRNLSEPLGTTGWFQGNPTVFTAHTGAPEAYVGVNFNSTTGIGTISNWLITPPLNLHDGATVSFATRTAAGSEWPDRLEVRLSTGGSCGVVGGTTAVGDFTTLLSTINPTLAAGGYPEQWTTYELTLDGVGTGQTGCVGFRYHVTDGGPDGAASNYIGLDSVSYTSDGPTTPPQNSINVLGGTAAVSASTLVEIGSLTGTSPVRLFGSDRSATAAAVSAHAFPDAGAVDTVYIATGSNFPDALAGGAAAASEDAPLLLVTRDGIPTATAVELGRLQPGAVKVLGGTAAVSASTLVEIGSLTGTSPVRLFGSDRSATAAAVSAHAFPDAGAVDTVYIATGSNFPDALAGGAAAASEDAPLLLVTRDGIPTATAVELGRLLPPTATPVHDVGPQ